MKKTGEGIGEKQSAPLQMRESDFREVCGLVRDMTGINLTDTKRELVQARLGKRIRSLGLKSLGDYLSFVREEQTQEELVAMLDALSTNLTSFWRESQHFEFMSEHVVPAMIARATKTRDWRIRGWSAGCSTGEEPYGLAMLITEALDEPAKYDLQILATDLSTRALKAAKEGVYAEHRIKDIPIALRRKYLEPVTSASEKHFRMSDYLRTKITFGRLNLMEHWPMAGPFDFIFCRNVMIYFDKPTQARLVNRFQGLLRQGGILFVGHSESLAGIEHNFRYLRPTIYEKV